MGILDDDFNLKRVSETGHADDLDYLAFHYNQVAFTKQLQAFFRTNGSLEVKKGSNGFKIGNIITKIAPDYLKKIEIIPSSGILGPETIPEFHVKVILGKGEFIYFRCWYNISDNNCIRQIMKRLITPLNVEMLREKVFFEDEKESFLKSSAGLPLASIFQILVEKAQKVCPEFFNDLKDSYGYMSEAFSICHSADPGFAH